jgi:hypothetical protein
MHETKYVDWTEKRCTKKLWGSRKSSRDRVSPLWLASAFDAREERRDSEAAREVEDISGRTHEMGMSRKLTSGAMARFGSWRAAQAVSSR